MRQPLHPALDGAEEERQLGEGLGLENPGGSCSCRKLGSSVEDPDLSDPFVFGPPLDLDPFARGTDPDPSIIEQNLSAKP